MAKSKKKVVKIDAQLAKQAEDYPKVKNAPEGYPHLLGVAGKTWYERAHNYERIYHKKVEPLNKEQNND